MHDLLNRGIAAPFRRRRCAPSLILLLLCVSPAQAEPGSPTGLFVQADLGTQRFTQDSHAPPICCGERDEWEAWGPAVRLGVGWLFESDLSLKVQVHGATSAIEGDDVDGDIHRIGATFGLDWYAPIGPLQPSIGVGLTGLGYKIDYKERRGSAEMTQTGVLVGAEIRSGLRYWLNDQFAVGADARFALYPLTNQALDLTVGVTYAGF